MTETIVMIHGMWGGAWYWEHYAAFFEEKGYRCVRPTLRFHAMDPREKPDPRLGTTSLLDYAGDLEKEIRELDAVPILMGHSMGGLLAQILGSRGLAKTLVLLTPASPYGTLALRPSVIRSFLSIFLRWGFWRKPMRQRFNEAVYSMLNLMPVEARRETYGRFVYESGRAACEIGFWLFDLKKAAQVDASKVTCPVLVVAGAQDRITPAGVVRRVAKKYGPVCTYKEFARHAHWVIAEPGWEEITAYVYDWLQGVSGPARRQDAGLL
jgi:pimeloyl-ACP methyl ester carboxylesterase